MQNYRTNKIAHTTSWSLRPGMLCPSISFAQPNIEGTDLDKEARR